MNKQFLQFRFYIIALVLVLAGFILFVIARHCREQASREVLPVKAIGALPEFRVQDIAQIEISYGEHGVKLIQENDIWKLHTKGKPVVIADPDKVLQLLEEFTRVKLLRELTIGTEAEAGALALSTPTPKLPRCQVVLRDKKGNAVREMMLGKIHFSVGEQIGRYRTNIPDGRYVRIMSGGKPLYFLVSNPLSACVPLSSFWHQPLVCPNMGMPVIIRCTDLANKKILWEVRAEQHQYSLVKPSGKAINIKDMQQKIGFLTQAPLSRDIAQLNVAFKPDSRLDIIYANGFSYSLDMQNDPFDEWGRLGRLTPAYDPEFTFRMQSENDEAFEKRKKQYQAELEREKKLFGERIFVLRPNLISIFETVPEK